MEGAAVPRLGDVEPAEAEAAALPVPPAATEIPDLPKDLRRLAGVDAAIATSARRELPAAIEPEAPEMPRASPPSTPLWRAMRWRRPSRARRWADLRAAP